MCKKGIISIHSNESPSRVEYGYIPIIRRRTGYAVQCVWFSGAKVTHSQQPIHTFHVWYHLKSIVQNFCLIDVDGDVSTMMGKRQDLPTNTHMKNMIRLSKRRERKEWKCGWMGQECALVWWEMMNVDELLRCHLMRAKDKLSSDVHSSRTLMASSYQTLTHTHATLRSLAN